MVSYRRSKLTRAGKSAKVRTIASTKLHAKSGAQKDWGRAKAMPVRSFVKTSVPGHVDDRIAAPARDESATLKGVRTHQRNADIRLSQREAAVLTLVLKKMRVRGPVGALTAEQVAELMTAAIPETGPSPWDELIGPFYSTASLALLRNVTRQALQKMRQAGRLLSVTTSDGKILYPSFQFDEHHEPIEGLSDVLGILAPAIPDGWTRSLWLTGSVEAWGGRSAIDKLRTRNPDDRNDAIVAARENVSARMPR